MIHAREVAIVIPFSDRADLFPEERIGLAHLEHFLGGYDRYLMLPDTMRFELPGYRVKRFPDRFFGSVENHSRLMLSARFYEAFQHYEFILIYHPDALVFSDDLVSWCNRGFDFIGAPGGANPPLSFVGNGGFSLRRVQAFLDVFQSERYSVDPEVYWNRFCSGRSALFRLLNLPRRYLKRLHRLNNINREIAINFRNRSYKEDIFIGTEARKYAPHFRIPEAEIAMRFAFDDLPRVCLQKTGGRLPFGCHAWYKQDRAFWQQFLLPHIIHESGYHVRAAN